MKRAVCPSLARMVHDDGCPITCPPSSVAVFAVTVFAVAVFAVTVIAITVIAITAAPIWEGF